MVTKMIRMVSVLTVCAGFVFGAAAVVAGDKHDHNEKVTLEGEVLDLYCFMNHPEDGQGSDHAKCARACIKKGLPIGFLADGKVYLIIGKDHEPVTDMVVEYAGTQSRLTGTLVEHHGVMAIELESIGPVEEKKG